MAQVETNEFDSTGEFDEIKSFNVAKYVFHKFGILEERIIHVTSKHTYKYFFQYQVVYENDQGENLTKSFKIIDKIRAEQVQDAKEI